MPTSPFLEVDRERQAQDRLQESTTPHALPQRSIGQSTRPAQGTRNLKTDLLEELHETLIVHEGSRDLRVSKQRALIKSLAARAIKGDTGAAVKLIDLYIRIFGLQEQGLAEPAQPLSAEEQEVLAALEPRLTEISGIRLPLRRVRDKEDEDA
jgi:uncharacterized protein DUF5681